MSTHTKNIYFLLSGIVFASVIFFPVVKVLADDIDVTATVPAICGNSFQEGAEECDDGNVVDGDGCSSVCENEGGGGGDDDDDNGGGGAPPPAPVVPVPFCGDGVVNGADECDDGNGNHDDFCNNICKIPVCGDGQAQGAEQCDDGNVLNNDGCSQVCIVEPPIVCGDGQAQGAEQCDDGNDVERDGCSTQCFLDPAPVCGNALVEFGEICDDGNDIGRDGCSVQCLPENPSRCGNRLVEFGEQCDDGNLAGGDGCSGWCQQEPAPICGNSVKERGEVCDDGNLRDDDGCNNRCQFVPLPGTVCGNGVREAGEQCDDGNLHGGDGCTGACQNENNEDAHGNNAQNPDVQNPDPVLPIVENPDPPNEDNQDPNQDPNEEVQNNDSTASSSSPIAPIFEVAPPTTTPILSGVEKDAPFTKKVSVVAQNVSKNIANTVQFLSKEAKVIGQVAREVANNPQVEETTKTVVAPAAAAVVVASVVPSLASILIPFLRFVFLQPLLLFGRKKRQAWGQIYNSLTKLPVDLAMIRLVDAKTKRIVQSRVTDAAGRYFFIAEPGEYLLEVAKPGFSFPSSLLQSVKTDGKLVDIYHGELVQVTASGIGITPNIPLDPVGANKTPRRIVWEKRWRVVQHGISVSGIFLTLVSLYIVPVWYMWVFLGVHILAYIGFMRFVKPKKPNGWGLVSEKSSNAPLGNAVVRLFTKQYNKLVSTQVTDKEGRYAFLVGPSEYYVTYEKKGYKQHTTESFQVAEQVDGSVIKEKVSLEKEK